ncbi:MAG: hypothetical protein P0Y53_25215 [Candidatus Pseudobacter hemicellulosilyticus]|uniref:Uncharacterized protein n=1 Tax=Candidatus Pseudobacter hemicellulosilyticus TaxID=3121375 RepID=A0AAJ5WS67_9BACT|nr:MAG: hypothetical protein P0Y53_25215 [Pseudobacter sp.]
MKLFCDDLTATQIAGITGISRITVNAYFKLIRTHIARFCEERSPVPAVHSEELTAFAANEELPEGLLPESTGARKAFYGIYLHDGMLYTDRIALTDPSWLYDWLKGQAPTNEAAVEQLRLARFSGLADFNQLRLLRLPGGQDAVRGRQPADELEVFWGLLKSRLVKFRGLNSSTLYLHVKETEFRYNYRERDIYEILMDILNTQPLHHSKTERKTAGQMLNTGA